MERCFCDLENLFKVVKKNGLFLRRHTLGVIFLYDVPLHTDFYKI